MLFTKPSYVPELPFSPPDSIPIHELLFGEEEKYGRYSKASSKPPFTCGISGRSYSVAEVTARIEFLSRALAARLNWRVDDLDELSKVISVFSANTIDTLTVGWASHRINGVTNNISATYSSFELAHQLKSVKAQALFTCVPLLEVALKSAEEAGIPRDKVFILDVPGAKLEDSSAPDLKTINDLIHEGEKLEPLPPLKWTDGQGARQTAFLCCSSGTSGLPKNVKISHLNVIAMMIQAHTHESVYKSVEPDMSLGVLPISHNYALVIVSHFSVYRGDGVVILPNFDLQNTLRAIEKYRLARLWMVPAMIGAMLKATAIVKNYDISSVQTVVVGASNLTKEVATQFVEMVQGCTLVQGYGLTETTVAVTFENPVDIMFGSCGHLFPGVEGRLLDTEGNDVKGFDTPGELLLRSKTIMTGYYNNDAATKEMLLDDGWLRTGDLVEFRKSPAGHTHLFLIDRIKELIKVRGMQVSPVELENFLLRNPKVQDVTVVPIPDDAAGELPMAFVVRAPAAKTEDEKVLKEELQATVTAAFSKHKHLAGGVEFVDALPKSPAGKTKRKVVKDWAIAAAAEAKKAQEAMMKIETFEFSSDDEDD